MDQNQLVIQSLKGADPTMVHQADAPNPVPSIVDAFKSFTGGGLQGLANQQGWQTPDWSQKLGAVLSSPEANAVLGVLKLSPTRGSSLRGKGTFDVLNEGAGLVGRVLTDYDPVTRHISVDYAKSFSRPPVNVGPIATAANRKSWSAGSDKVAEVLNELMKQYPEAKSIGGVRVSGSRQVGNRGFYSYVTRQLPGRE